MSAGVALPAAGATIVGQLYEPGVVWVTDASAIHPTTEEMRNTGKAFVPQLLVVPVGSTVRFPNDDPFFHSIFSASDADPFDIGFYPSGPGKEETFEHPGVLDVRCHIHALMHANIVVVDGPFAQTDSTFALTHVDPGERVVHAWSLSRGYRTATVRIREPDGAVSLRRSL